MASYLEEHELVVGRWYACETYDGKPKTLKYLGDGKFKDPDSSKEMSIIGDVRYVFKEIKV